jgi:branched-chain amino acid transport system ATP-binding protein
MNRPVDPARLAVDGAGVADGEVLLEVRNVTLSFGGVTAITDISFDVRKGEIRAIIGPNGAGKTSMLNVINGFYRPQKGVIVFRGEERRAMKPYEAAASGIARTPPKRSEILSTLRTVSPIRRACASLMPPAPAPAAHPSRRRPRS